MCFTLACRRWILVFAVLLLSLGVIARGENASAPPATPEASVTLSPEGESAAPDPREQELRRQLETLQGSVKSLEFQKSVEQKRLNDLQSEAGRLQAANTVLQAGRWLSLPVMPWFSPVGNAAFAFAAIALLSIVLCRPDIARKLLSLSYPFNVVVRPSGLRVPPIGNAGRTLWILLLGVLLALLALPAFSEETMESKFDTAVKYMGMTSLERAIYVLEHPTDPQTSMDLRLDADLVGEVNQAARRQRHPSVLPQDVPPVAFQAQVKKDDLRYHLLLAALYETAGRPEVKGEIEKAAALAFPEAAGKGAEVSFDMGVILLEWLAAYDLAPLLKRGLLQCEPAVSSVESAGQLVKLAHAKGMDDTALQLLEAMLARVTGVKAGMELLRLAKGLDGAAPVAEKHLDAFIAKGYFDELLSVADLAAEMGVAPKAGEALLAAAPRADGSSAMDRVLEAAKKHGILPAVAEKVQTAFASNSAMATWQVLPLVPAESGITILDTEKMSLAPFIAAVRMTPENKDAFKDLCEYPVAQQLENIIQSLGAEPKMRLNDLAVLARYYELANSPALSVTQRMIALQRSIRGLDTQADAASDAETRRQALLLSIEQAKSKERDLQNDLGGLRQSADSAQSALSQARHDLYVLLAELSAKAILILIGLWIAFSRAAAAARAAINYRFSHFCFAFIETIGFELCCTLIFAPGGIVAVLIGQDRLKHLDIAEMPRSETALPSPAPPRAASPANPAKETSKEPGAETGYA